MLSSDSNDIWSVTSFEIPCQARMAIQRQICVGTASSSVIWKRHDDHICQSWWPGTIWIRDLFQCHFRSCKSLACFFLLITSYWKEIERREWSHCVQLVKTYRLICILISFGHHLALRERKLRSKFGLDLSELRSHGLSPWQKKGFRITALAHFAQKFSRKASWLF